MLVVWPPGVDPDKVDKWRRPAEVVVDVGVATLRGRYLTLPGATAWDTWQRSRTGFVPVTNAVLDFPDGTSERAGVVHLSRHAVASGLRA